MEIKESIRIRKSVRTFNEQPLSEEDKQKLSDYLATLQNPFGIPIAFRFLNAKEHNLSSPVIVGTDQYVAAKVARVPQFELAYGYSFEAFCLYAASIGIGTVMLGGTFSRKAFEKAMEVQEGEVMPLATPVGYRAEKKSLRERMMRKVIKADKRRPFEELFFENDFTQALSEENAGKYGEALEMVRLAPSAVNKQPWRAVVCGSTVHFFKKAAKSLAGKQFDIQKVDMGIALAHFDLTLKEEGIGGQFVDKVPSFEVGDEMEYVISYEE